jgi:hypothetical protein
MRQYIKSLNFNNQQVKAPETDNQTKTERIAQKQTRLFDKINKQRAVNQKIIVGICPFRDR